MSDAEQDGAGQAALPGAHLPPGLPPPPLFVNPVAGQPRPPGPTSAAATDLPGFPGIADRERYARLLLNAYERGLLSDVEYVERSGAIESAGSVEELNRIVQELPVLGANRGGTPLPGSAVQAPAPPLSSPVTVGQGVGLSGKASLPHAPDPVDLARLGKTTPGAGQGDHRWFALVVIVVLFIVLIIFGAVLIGRVHANNTPSSSTHIPSLVKVASRA